MEFEEINEALEIGLEKVKTADRYLLEHDVSERSISHKLACYLSEQFYEYNVDCEYNSNGLADAEKKYIRLLSEIAANLGMMRETDGEEEIINRNVYPDIIVHLRGYGDQNLLIIEMKKTSSTVASEYDYEKLRRYTSPEYGNELNYSFGAFIFIGVGGNAGDLVIEWFQNGEKIYISD